MSRRDRKNGELNKQLDNMNKAFGELNDVLGDVVDKMDTMAKISKDVEKVQKVITTTYKEQAKANKAIAEEQERQNKARTKSAEEDYNKFIEKGQKQYSGKVNTNKIPSSIKEWYNYREDTKRAQDLKTKYENAVKNAQIAVGNDPTYMKNGNMSSEGYKRMQELINKEMDAADDLANGAGKFNKTAATLSVVSDTLGAVVKKLRELLTKGLNNQTGVYESTFENISVRTGMTRGNYYSTQSQVNNQLSNLGLRNNIATSEVQQMWNAMASNGMSFNDENGNFDEAKLLADSIDAIITSKIVPYLDTTSQENQLLNKRLNGEFFKQIRGINQLNQEIAGGNYATQEILNQMVDQLAPMSDEAIQNLTQGSAEMSSLINILMNEQGWTKDQATSFANMYYKQRNYSDQILSSGTVYEKIALNNVLTSGYNLSDIRDANNIVGENLDTLLLTSGFFMDNNSTQGMIVNNQAGASIYGSGNTQNMLAMAQKMIASGETGTDLAARTDLSDDELASYAQRALADYANDKNQTNEQLQNITLENLMNELAVVDQWLGNWTDVIVTAIKGLGTVITGYIGTKLIGGVVGKGIGALAGTAAGGTGAGLLAIGGGIAIGAAAGLAISAAINNAAHERAKEENQTDDKKASMKARGLAEDLGISEGAASLEVAGSNIYNSDENFLGSKFDNYQNAELFGAKLGMFDVLDVKDFDQTLKEATKDVDTLKYNKAKIGKALNYGGLGFGSTTLSHVAKAWMIGLFSQGYTGKNANVYKALDETLNIGAFTPDEASMLEHMSGPNALTRSQFNYIVNAMKNADMWLWNENGKWVMPNEGDYDKALKISGIPEEHREWLSSHRQGLAEVPYDNYLASLHEGEAILTASTANELRGLLDEYRANNYNIQVLEIAVQNQTIELVNKLDELISVVGSTGGTTPITTTMTDQMAAKAKLLNSMTHLTNSKAIQ